MKEVFSKADNFLVKYPIQKLMRDEAIQKQSELEQELTEDFKFILTNLLESIESIIKSCKMI